MSDTPRDPDHDPDVQEMLADGVPADEILLLDCPYCGGISYYSGGFTSGCTWCGLDIADFSDDAYSLADYWGRDLAEVP